MRYTCWSITTAALLGKNLEVALRCLHAGSLAESSCANGGFGRTNTYPTKTKKKQSKELHLHHTANKHQVFVNSWIWISHWHPSRVQSPETLTWDKRAAALVAGTTSLAMDHKLPSHPRYKKKVIHGAMPNWLVVLSHFFQIWLSISSQEKDGNKKKHIKLSGKLSPWTYSPYLYFFKTGWASAISQGSKSPRLKPPITRICFFSTATAAAKRFVGTEVVGVQALPLTRDEKLWKFGWNKCFLHKSGEKKGERQGKYENIKLIKTSSTRA